MIEFLVKICIILFLMVVAILMLIGGAALTIAGINLLKDEFPKAAWNRRANDE